MVGDGGKRGRGRPRDPDLDRAVLDAAGALLSEQGYRGVSMDALARRAGTTKTAIYRRWPSRTAVLVDVLAERLPAPESAPLGADIGTVVAAAARGLAAALDDPAVLHGLTGLLAEAAADRSVADLLRRRLVEPQLDAARVAADRASVDSPPPDWLSPELLADVIAGTVLQHVVVRGQPADPTFVHNLASMVTHAARQPGHR